MAIEPKKRQLADVVYKVRDYDVTEAYTEACMEALHLSEVRSFNPRFAVEPGQSWWFAKGFDAGLKAKEQKENKMDDLKLGDGVWFYSLGEDDNSISIEHDIIDGMRRGDREFCAVLYEMMCGGTYTRHDLYRTKEEAMEACRKELDRRHAEQIKRLEAL